MPISCYRLLVCCFLLSAVLLSTTASSDSVSPVVQRRRNAYATMMYMGTPRDYEFYVATRVMLRSLRNLRVDADLVVIASKDVPLRWIRSLEEEDGAKVVRVDNLNNPYSNQANFDMRFKLTLNKIYAWSLFDYDRVVMLDSDNLFLRNTDELFNCGQFCAVFINPCIFHTGLFVLEPSKAVFSDMLRDIRNGRQNPDGADQGFIGGFFPDLLDQPMFHEHTTRLNGTFRLPLGYQMDASYYYLKLRWSIPCGANSVITFPSAPLLKPWYWWSWPVLPLGISWHQQRLKTLGYADEMVAVVVQAAMYVALIAITRLARPNMLKLWHRRISSDKSVPFLHAALKLVAVWSIVAAYALPFLVIPRTVHPVVGWGLYFLGSFALSSVSTNAFLVPTLPVLVPWFGIFGSLLVMVYPWYPNGIIRALVVFGYACLSTPFIWVSLIKILNSLQLSLEKDAFYQRIGDSNPPATECNKLC